MCNTQAAPHILVLDDDWADRKLIRRLLSLASEKFVISEFGVPSDAIQALIRGRVSCAIVDFRLGGENGIEVARQMRNIDPNLPVILTTGQGSEEVVRQALTSGISDYISKIGLTSFSLARVIDNAIKQCRVEKEIRERQQSLVEFSSILVHDFRSPIRQMLMLCNFLSDALGGSADAEIIELLGRIKGSAFYLDDLVCSLHQFNLGNVESVAIDVVDLAKVVDQATFNVKELFEDSGGAIIYHDLPHVMGSESFLTQVMQNLIQNAIKYRAERSPEIRIEAVVDQGVNRIAVRDNGIGIAEPDLERIFSPFRRLHGREIPGAGLGLATCKRLLEKMHGDIWCESEVGSGSSFFLELPVAD